MRSSPCDLDGFSPEFQLACACCRVKPTPADWSRIQRLTPLIDVPSFVELVIERHRIGPLVHAALRQLPPDSLRPGLMAPLAVEARSNAIEALRAVRSHVLFTDWFRAAGIEWLPFKGNTVAQGHYGDVQLRQVNDMDIWVPESKLDQARDILAAKGFRWTPGTTNWDLAVRGPKHRAFLSRYHYQEEHRSAELGRVELHWQLTDNPHLFNLSPQQVLARGRSLDMGGAELRVMNDTDLLLYLCEHGGRHGWYRLKWLADLPQLLEQAAWDWPEVFDRAERAGCRRSMLLGLSLAQDLFGWQAPALVKAQITGQRSIPLLKRVVRTGLTGPQAWWVQSRGAPLGWFVRTQVNRVLLSNWRAVSVVIWRLSLSPNDLSVIAIPDRWFFLYRIVRPLLFAWRLSVANLPIRWVKH